MRPYVKLLWQLVFRLLLRILALQQLQDSVVRPMRDVFASSKHSSRERRTYDDATTVVTDDRGDTADLAYSPITPILPASEWKKTICVLVIMFGGRSP